MIQIIKYKCCGNAFAACHEPDCYTDKDWLKSLRKYVSQGATVEMIQPGQLQFKKCECKKQPASEEINLFNLENKTS
ncbi:hypothetical protein [uncultured Chryseobacterium sp.]|uniref:hypothetical protein n=1 Tax=uncultured Chryseobacterium sp. TaxID=259322 RepID=UPI0025ED4C9C|nr:hypothetical protein [uncultured Chryseobacterium sp.]